MAQITDLKKGDRVIYYGYAIPRRRGDYCRVNAINTTDKEIVVIFDSDRFCISCAPYLLRKMMENKEETA